LVNSRNVCGRRYHANAQLRAHNGRALELKPKVRSGCKGKRHRRSR
jgi:hypothetical protein